MKKENAWRVPFAVFCIALAARAFFLFFVQTFKIEHWDWQVLHINGWLDIAEQLAAGKGYSIHKLLTYFPVDPAATTAARGPVPVFVLAFLVFLFNGNFFYPLIFFSWVLSAFSAVLVYRISKEIFPKEKTALAASLIYAFYLPEMYLSVAYAAASESLFTLLLLLYFWVFAKEWKQTSPRLAAAAGILAALAFLSRPVVFFFPLFYAVAMFWVHRTKAVKSILICFAVFAACVAPWGIRNQIVLGKPVLSTTLGGYNLLRHNGSIRDNNFKLQTHEDFLPLAEQTVKNAGKDFSSLSEIEADALFKKEAVRIISKYPLRYAKLCVLRAGWLWYKVQAEKPLYKIPNLIIYLFMFPGFLIALRRGGFPAVLVLHIFYFVAIHAAVNAQFRFIAPLMPYGIMIAVRTAGDFWGRVRK